jgi:sulfur carrier protein
MKISLNNREVEFDKDNLSINEILELKKLSFRMRVIKINGVLIPKERYDSTIVKDGDNIQVLYLMSGG